MFEDEVELTLLESKSRMARDMQDAAKQNAVERQIWRIQNRAWNRANPDAFAWISRNDLDLWREYLPESDFYQYDQWATRALPAEVEDEILHWRQHFDAFELCAGKSKAYDDYMVFGHFDGRTALLARWTTKHLRLPFWGEMIDIVECRRQVRRMKARMRTCMIACGVWAWASSTFAVAAIAHERISSAAGLAAVSSLFLSVVFGLLLFQDKILSEKRQQLKEKYPKLSGWL